MDIKTKMIRMSSQLILLLVLLWCMPVNASMLVDTRAPDFTLKDSTGKVYELAGLQSQPMVMLYFFDTESKPSRGGLVTLDQLCAKYARSDLVVWAITRSNRDKVKDFVAQNKIDFPVLIDDGKVSKSYQAERILPTTCILGPDLKVLDLLHGGGQSANIMLVRLAQRALQHRKSEFAQAIGDKVVQSDPENVEARLVSGYAALNQGNLDASEAAFTRLAEQGGQAAAAGQEGLSAVAVQKGQVKKALSLAQQVEQADPSRGYVHVVKADVLYTQNKPQAAEQEYQKAIAKENTEPYHRARAYNQLARIRADQGDFEQAKALYTQAEAADPYFIEAATNKGLIYEKQGQWDQALECYANAQRIDQSDVFSLTLQKKLLAMLQLEKDRAEKERVDTLVKELAQRYRSRQGDRSEKPQDDWTSRPMVLSFVDFSETGGLPVRDGLATILTVQLSDILNGSGRVQVVERVIVDKLLQELNLGSSDLADPANALELGKVLSAKLMVTGSLYYHSDNYLLTMRLIDTETTRIAKVISAEITGSESAPKQIEQLTRRILAQIVRQYPLQGYVVQADGDEVMINLGSNQGVVVGACFDIVEPAAPVTYRGRQLQGRPKVIGQVEIVDVEKDFSRARVLDATRPITRDDRLKEKISETTRSYV